MFLESKSVISSIDLFNLIYSSPITILCTNPVSMEHVCQRLLLFQFKSPELSFFLVSLPPWMVSFHFSNTTSIVLVSTFVEKNSLV